MTFLATPLPVGTIIHSMLTETQFQDNYGTDWVLADGRSVTGTLYQAITGSSTIPDLRGMFLRGKNNSRGDGTQDPDGERALGSYQADRNQAHTHTVDLKRNSATLGAVNDVYRTGDTGSTQTFTTSSSGGTDARPRNVAVNIFVRIN